MRRTLHKKISTRQRFLGKIIDWHAHIYASEEVAGDLRAWDGQTWPSSGERACPMVLENFLDAHCKAGIGINVVKNAAHYPRGKTRSEELPSIQKWSDCAAEIESHNKGVLYAFAPAALRRSRVLERDGKSKASHLKPILADHRIDLRRVGAISSEREAFDDHVS